MITRLKVISEISGGAFAMFCRIIVGFVGIPFFIQYLGSEKYGVWMLALSSITFVNFLDGGVFATVQNKLTEFQVNKNNTDFRDYLNAGFILGGFIILLGILISLLIYHLDIKTIFSINENISETEIKNLFIVITLITTFTIGLTNCQSFYASKIQLGKIKYIEGIITVLTFVFTLFVLIKTSNFILVVILYSIPLFLIRVVILLKLLYKSQLKIEINKKVINIIIKEFKSSIPFLGIKLCEVIIVFTPNYLISSYYNLNEVTKYNIVLKFTGIILLLTTAILPTIWPMFSKSWHMNKYEWIRTLLQRAIIITSFIYAVFLCIMYSFGEYIIRLFTGGNIIVNNGYISLFIIQCFATNIVYFVSTFLHSINDFKFEFYIFLMLTISLAFGGAFLLKNYSINSLLIHTALSWITIAFIPMFFRTKKLLKVN